MGVGVPDFREEQVENRDKTFYGQCFTGRKMPSAVRVKGTVNPVLQGYGRGRTSPMFIWACENFIAVTCENFVHEIRSFFGKCFW